MYCAVYLLREHLQRDTERIKKTTKQKKNLILLHTNGWVAGGANPLPSTCIFIWILHFWEFIALFVRPLWLLPIHFVHISGKFMLRTSNFHTQSHIYSLCFSLTVFITFRCLYMGIWAAHSDFVHTFWSFSASVLVKQFLLSWHYYNLIGLFLFIRSWFCRKLDFHATFIRIFMTVVVVGCGCCSRLIAMRSIKH